jgi:glutamate 5-kinase
MPARPSLKDVRNVVIKLGTSTCIKNGNTLDSPLLLTLAQQIAELMGHGIRVVLVTSGAVGMGRGLLGQTPGPVTVPEKQALAALGQVALINAYASIFGLLELQVAQVLLTRDDIASHERYLNARNALHTLFGHHVLPVINENDTVATEEIRIGDNDNLASLVGSLVDADLVINLTNTDGLWTADPATHPEARRISMVERLDELEVEIGNISQGGTGGMATKLQAARIATGYGAYMVIARSRDPRIIARILAGDDVGTLFLPQRARLQSRKRWIAYHGREKGTLQVDAGAATALKNKGRSLLAAGIKQVVGEFEVGDLVRVEDLHGTHLGRGLTNYAAHQVRLIQGLPSESFEGVLGFKAYDEVIHRNNLVLEQKP